MRMNFECYVCHPSFVVILKSVVLAMEHATVTPIVTSHYKQGNTSGKSVYM
jgi:hypothetical protein